MAKIIYFRTVTVPIENSNIETKTIDIKYKINKNNSKQRKDRAIHDDSFTGEITKVVHDKDKYDSNKALTKLIEEYI